MRILHLGKFFSPHRGGIETHLEVLCRELSRAAEVEVIVANHRPGDSIETIGGARVRRLHSIMKLAAAPICQRLTHEIRATPADIVHLHMPNPYAALAFLMSGHPAPLVISWHSDIVRQRVLAQMIGPFERAIVRRAAAIIASSPDYVATSPILHRHEAKCRVIPFGIDHRDFGYRDADFVDAVRRQYGERIVLAVGRLVYYKGFEYLVRAMADVRGRLLIIGEGPLLGLLQSEARRHGVSERVALLGNVSAGELRNYYQAADVFVLPSIARSEAFGIVQLEAMASGRPVVNTRLRSGVPFVSRDNETGITVEPGSASALAGAINRLLDNPELATRYGAAAQRRVRDHFSLSAMVARTRELYDEVVNEDDDSVHLPAAAMQLGH